ncbi:MAG: protein O-mannosyl-transferase family, partial [Gemmatimonas sp.]
MVLLGLYLSTAAQDLTFWDAAELMAAAHTLGIPHPPGTPLWVLLGKVAATLFGSAPPPRAITLLSVWSGAITGGVTALMAARWIGARGAVVSAVMAGAMYSVWNNATETEVYAVALLASVVMLAVGEYAGRADTADAQRRRA